VVCAHPHVYHTGYRGTTTLRKTRGGLDPARTYRADNCGIDIFFVIMFYDVHICYYFEEVEVGPAHPPPT
jgi:hypothetical protein